MFLYLSLTGDNPQDSITKVLASRNKEEITAYLLPYKRVWYGLGIDFGIPTEKMDEIRQLYDDPGDCLQEVIGELVASPEIQLTSIETLGGMFTREGEKIVIMVEKATLKDIFMSCVHQ